MRLAQESGRIRKKTESRSEMKDSNRKPELLIPASNLEVLKTAVVFGADAVYILSLRHI